MRLRRHSCGALEDRLLTTEWEFFNAVEASAGANGPEVLVYKKTNPKLVDITDAGSARAAMQDRARLEEFFLRNFFNDLGAVDDEGQVVRWDLTNETSAVVLGHHALSVEQVRISPRVRGADGFPLVLTASLDKTARLWAPARRLMLVQSSRRGAHLCRRQPWR